MTLILASASTSRAKLLTQAGVPFTVQASGVDEAVLKTQHQGLSLNDMALLLANHKAADVAQHYSDDFIVCGSDQMLACQGKWYDKPATMEDAKQQLVEMRGQTLTFATAMVLWQNNAVIWEHVATNHITMRTYSDAFLDSYLEQAGHSVLKAVGACQIEGLGLQLMESLEGDFFSIVGLPMLPLLDALRRFKILHG
jgi:septum formation protein